MTTDEISERLFKVRDHWREAHALTPDETEFLLGATSQLLGQVEHLENYCDEECLGRHRSKGLEVEVVELDAGGDASRFSVPTPEMEQFRQQELERLHGSDAE